MSLGNKIKQLFGAQDMTVGKPMTSILKFSIPLLIGNFVQQLYSTVDSIVVGNYVTLDETLPEFQKMMEAGERPGDVALAAIGLTGPIVNLLLVLFMAISTGAGIMVAQYFGAKQKKELSLSVGNGISLIVIATLALMAVSIPLVDVMLKLIKTPEGMTFKWAHDYLMIILLGLLGSAFYNIISGILRGLGDSLYPFLFLVIASVLNIFLDIWFVKYLGWATAGAAWATIIAQAVSAVLCIIRLLRMRDVVEINKDTLKPRKQYTGQLLSLGLPAGITQAIFSMSMLLVQSLTNAMGNTVIATCNAIMRVDGFAMLPNFTFGMAISTFVGQNIGAKKMDRISQGTKDVLLVSLGTSFVLVSLIIIFGRNMIGLFTTTEQIRQLGGDMMRILAVGYVAMAVMQVYGGIMRGAGDTMPSMWISLLTMLLVRLPSAYLFVYLTRSEAWPNGSPYALYWSLLINWVIGALINYLWYRRGTWKQKAII